MKSIEDAYFDRYVKPKMMKRLGMKTSITQKRSKRMKKQWRLKL